MHYQIKILNVSRMQVTRTVRYLAPCNLCPCRKFPICALLFWNQHKGILYCTKKAINNRNQNSTLATVDVVLVSVAILQDQVKFKMGSCSSISKTSSSTILVQPRRAQAVPGSSFPSVSPERPTEIGSFYESGGNSKQEQVFNPDSGRLERMRQEEHVWQRSVHFK